MVGKQTLLEDMRQAMRTGDNARRDTLRLLLAAVKQEEVDGQKELGEDALQKLLAKQAKQRRETIADAEKAGRPELAQEARAELVIIEDYLPQMLSRDEIREIAEQVVTELGVDDMRAMGQVMGVLMPRLQDRADGRDVSDVVRELLR